MIDLEDAQRLVLEACPPLAPVTVAAAEVVGRVLAADIVAAEDVPPSPTRPSTVTRCAPADVAAVPVELRGRRRGRRRGGAGDAPVAAGEAIRIMTGAPLPDGADAVVMVEDTERVDGGRVRLRAASSGGLPSGTSATTSVRRHCVHHRHASSPRRRRRARQHQRPTGDRRTRRPGSAVLSTGDELVTDGSPLRPGQIRESNAVMLAPLLAEAGCVVDHRASCPTTRRRWRPSCATPPDRATPSSRAAGVSMGDFDVVKAVLGRIAEMSWMQIAIKPAKPFAFGTARRHADVRPARQPGELAGQFRAPRPAGAAPDDGPPPPRPTERGRRWPTRISRAVPTARSTSAGHGRVRRRRPLPRRPVSDRAATNWRRRRSPTLWPSCPTATGLAGRQRGARADARRLTHPVSVVVATIDLVDPFGRDGARPAHLGDRSLQLPVHVLHAGGRHEVAAALRGADVRGDRTDRPADSSSASGSTASASPVASRPCAPTCPCSSPSSPRCALAAVRSTWR